MLKAVLSRWQCATTLVDIRLAGAAAQRVGCFLLLNMSGWPCTPLLHLVSTLCANASSVVWDFWRLIVASCVCFRYWLGGVRADSLLQVLGVFGLGLWFDSRFVVICKALQ
jgi:hypothetical protein